MGKHYDLVQMNYKDLKNAWFDVLSKYRTSEGYVQLTTNPVYETTPPVQALPSSVGHNITLDYIVSDTTSSTYLYYKTVRQQWKIVKNPTMSNAVCFVRFKSEFRCQSSVATDDTVDSYVILSRGDVNDNKAYKILTSQTAYSTSDTTVGDTVITYLSGGSISSQSRTGGYAVSPPNGGEYVYYGEDVEGQFKSFGCILSSSAFSNYLDKTFAVSGSRAGWNALISSMSAKTDKLFISTWHANNAPSIPPFLVGAGAYPKASCIEELPSDIPVFDLQNADDATKILAYLYDGDDSGKINPYAKKFVGQVGLDTLIGKIKTLTDTLISKTSIVNNLTTDDATKVLSAKQGKVLNDGKVNKVNPTSEGILNHDGQTTFHINDNSFQVKGYRDGEIFEIKRNPDSEYYDEETYIHTKAHITKAEITDSLIVDGVDISDSIESLSTTSISANKKATTALGYIGDVSPTSITTTYEMSKHIDEDGSIVSSTSPDAVVKATISDYGAIKINQLDIVSDRSYPYLIGALYKSDGTLLRDISSEIKEFSTSSVIYKDIIIDCTGASTIAFTTTLMGTQTFSMSGITTLSDAIASVKSSVSDKVNKVNPTSSGTGSHNGAYSIWQSGSTSPTLTVSATGTRGGGTSKADITSQSINLIAPSSSNSISLDFNGMSIVKSNSTIFSADSEGLTINGVKFVPEVYYATESGNVLTQLYVASNGKLLAAKGATAILANDEITADDIDTIWDSV